MICYFTTCIDLMTRYGKNTPSSQKASTFSFPPAIVALFILIFQLFPFIFHSLQSTARLKRRYTNLLGPGAFAAGIEIFLSS